MLSGWSAFLMYGAHLCANSEANYVKRQLSLPPVTHAFWSWRGAGKALEKVEYGLRRNQAVEMHIKS